MDKRNSYFSKYGISTVTFTNKELKDVEKCFEQVENYLKEKSYNSTSLQTTMSKFEELTKKYKL